MRRRQWQWRGCGLSLKNLDNANLHDFHISTSSKLAIVGQHNVDSDQYRDRFNWAASSCLSGSFTYQHNDGGRPILANARFIAGCVRFFTFSRNFDRPQQCPDDKARSQGVRMQCRLLWFRMSTYPLSPKCWMICRIAIKMISPAIQTARATA